jgi:hypothetical protein
MARYLFTTWEGGGHVQPMLLVARDLAARGHAVLVLSDPCNALRRRRPGRAVPRLDDRALPDRQDPRRRPVEGPRGRQSVGGDPAPAGSGDGRPRPRLRQRHAGGDRRLRAGRRRLAGAAAGPDGGGGGPGLPLALLAANIWSLPTMPGAPPFGAGMLPATNDEERAMHAMVGQMSRGFFQAGLPDLNAARAALGLPPLSDLFEQLDGAKAILLATSKAFDFAPDPLPAPFRPCRPVPGRSGLGRAVRAAARRRAAGVVSFSSLYQAQEPVLRAIVAALGQLAGARRGDHRPDHRSRRVRGAGQCRRRSQRPARRAC